MEIILTKADSIPAGSVVSIRAGSTRRQAPLCINQPFKFPTPKSFANPFKVDIFAPIGKARLVLRPDTESYRAVLETDLDDGSAGALEFQVRDAPELEGRPSRPVTPAVGFDPPVSGMVDEKSSSPEGRQAAAESARNYLEEHGLLQYIQALLQSVIQEKPAKPFEYMVRQLQAGWDTPASPTRPSSPAKEKPEAAMKPVEKAKEEEKPKEEKPAPKAEKKLVEQPKEEKPAEAPKPVAVEKPIEAPKAEAKSVEQPKEEKPAEAPKPVEQPSPHATKPAAAPKPVAAETPQEAFDLERIKDSVKDSITKASESGNLDDCITRVLTLEAEEKPAEKPKEEKPAVAATKPEEKPVEVAATKPAEKPVEAPKEDAKPLEKPAEAVDEEVAMDVNAIKNQVRASLISACESEFEQFFVELNQSKEEKRLEALAEEKPAEKPKVEESDDAAFDLDAIKEKVKESLIQTSEAGEFDQFLSELPVNVAKAAEVGKPKEEAPAEKAVEKPKAEEKTEATLKTEEKPAEKPKVKEKIEEKPKAEEKPAEKPKVEEKIEEKPKANVSRPSSAVKEKIDFLTAENSRLADEAKALEEVNSQLKEENLQLEKIAETPRETPRTEEKPKEAPKATQKPAEAQTKPADMPKAVDQEQEKSEYLEQVKAKAATCLDQGVRTGDLKSLLVEEEAASKAAEAPPPAEEMIPEMNLEDIKESVKMSLIKASEVGEFDTFLQELPHLSSSEKSSPRPEEKAAEAPKAEEKAVEAPKTTEKPKAEEKAVQEPKAAEKPVEKPKAEEKPAEKPKADEKIVEEKPLKKTDSNRSSDEAVPKSDQKVYVDQKLEENKHLYDDNEKLRLENQLLWSQLADTLKEGNQHIKDTNEKLRKENEELKKRAEEALSARTGGAE